MSFQICMVFCLLLNIKYILVTEQFGYHWLSLSSNKQITLRRNSNFITQVWNDMRVSNDDRMFVFAWTSAIRADIFNKYTLTASHLPSGRLSSCSWCSIHLDSIQHPITGDWGGPGPPLRSAYAGWVSVSCYRTAHGDRPPACILLLAQTPLHLFEWNTSLVLH